MSKQTIVWTDADLDGAASFLVLSWYKPGINLIPRVCTGAKLRECYLAWLQTNKASDYEKIYILDLDTTDIADLVDNANVVIFDHHKTHVAQAANYKHCKAIVSDCKSTAQLIHETFKTKKDFLTTLQKMLIALTSDFDSGTNSFKQSQDLNNIFWTLQGNRVIEFSKQFQKGFCGFSPQHQAALAIHASKVKNIINDLKLYQGKINQHKCIATFCTTCHSEVAQHVFATTDADILMMVNVDRETVSFRCSKTCTADVSLLAQKLCEGGGHAQAAGGKLTQTFINFTQTLQPV